MSKHRAGTMAEAKGPGKKAKKVLDHVRVYHGMHNGKPHGHVVEHHFRTEGGDGMAMGYHEPEKVPFGPGQGDEMMAHVGKTMGAESEPDGDEAGEE